MPCLRTFIIYNRVLTNVSELRRNIGHKGSDANVQGSISESKGQGRKAILYSNNKFQYSEKKHRNNSHYLVSTFYALGWVQLQEHRVIISLHHHKTPLRYFHFIHREAKKLIRGQAGTSSCLTPNHLLKLPDFFSGFPISAETQVLPFVSSHALQKNLKAIIL